MKAALALVIVMLGCKRPVERTAPVAIGVDAVLIDGRLEPVDGLAPTDAATEVVTTVIQVNYLNNLPILVLAAGKDKGIAMDWVATFVADGPVTRCTIVSVGRFETHCRLDGARLPSNVVRLAPQPAD